MPSFKTAFVAFSLAVALGIAVFGFLSLRTLVHALDSPDWPQVLGSVRSAEVKRGCGRQRNSYEVAVRYDYSVHGLEYHGTRVDFGRGYCGSEAGAKALSQSFAPGAAVKVYFDPAQPERSVLLAGKVDWLMIIEVGLYLLAVGVFLAVPWRILSGRLRVGW